MRLKDILKTMEELNIDDRNIWFLYEDGKLKGNILSWRYSDGKLIGLAHPACWSDDKDIGCLEIKHLGLYIDATDGDASKDTGSEMVREIRFDVGLVVRQLGGLVADFRTDGEVDASACKCCAAQHQEGCNQ